MAMEPLLLLLVLLGPAAALQCSDIAARDRIDCYPGSGASEANCVARGCCWVPTFEGLSNMPYCFFPRDFASYKADEVTRSGAKLHMALSRAAPSGHPADVSSLSCTVLPERPTRLRVRIEPASGSAGRWVPPLALDGRQEVSEQDSDFRVELREDPFGLKITRKDGRLLLDSISMPAPLIFADQFVQLSARLGTPHLFGFGQQQREFLHDLSQGWQTIALWARDIMVMQNINLYGVHNFMLGRFDDGTAFGVFFFNSNAQEVVLQPSPGITYRSIGGNLDFFLFSGPSPEQVVQQYAQLIGRPALPPYWALGFHLTRWGYNDLQQMREVLQRNLQANMPIEAQWADIEYMDKHKVWTFNPDTFGELPAYVRELHNRSMRFVAIVDPGISNQYPGKYEAFDSGARLDIFIKKSDGSPLIGKVWPGTVNFPDFTAPNVTGWWNDSAAKFRQLVAFDGLWLDMNEPANFDDGSTDGCPSGNTLDFPPYVPSIVGGSLIQKTICASAKQHLGRHYDLHNMFGYFEAKVTFDVLRGISPKKRPFLLSRSSFAGSGHFTGVWTGDNTAEWHSMYSSLAQLLNFNMFGVSMAGADICGFRNDASEELCVRWTQLGAFLPFMRNHNGKEFRAQDPAAWSPAGQKAMRWALRTRYALLPYLYTQLYFASRRGSPVLRPLFFEFPREPGVERIGTQFLLGPSLLVSPLFGPGLTQVNAFLPRERWCDLFSGRALIGNSSRHLLPAPWDRINVHVRGGSVLPVQPDPVPNSAAHAHLPYQLRVCLDLGGRAKGWLFMDDGESQLDSQTGSLIDFRVAGSVLRAMPLRQGRTNLTLGSMWISGVSHRPKEVSVNGSPVQHDFRPDDQLLIVSSMRAKMTEPLSVRWC